MSKWLGRKDEKRRTKDPHSYATVSVRFTHLY
jgi:hypothetical protein